MHDEERAFAEGTKPACARKASPHDNRLDWLAGLTAGKAVVIEGLEVVFIVIAVGAGRGLIVPASLGALAACVIVLLARRRDPPAAVARAGKCAEILRRRDAVGVWLFWTGEGLGVAWPGDDLAIPGLIVLFLAAALVLVRIVRSGMREVLQ